MLDRSTSSWYSLSDQVEDVNGLKPYNEQRSLLFKDGVPTSFCFGKINIHHLKGRKEWLSEIWADDSRQRSPGVHRNQVKPFITAIKREDLDYIYSSRIITIFWEGFSMRKIMIFHYISLFCWLSRISVLDQVSFRRILSVFQNIGAIRLVLIENLPRLLNSLSQHLMFYFFSCLTVYRRNLEYF